MLFVNILLLNLLIAMFRYVRYSYGHLAACWTRSCCSKRFDRVYDETQNIWYSQKYILTREYFSRGPLFPPFSVLFDVYYLIRLSIFFIRKQCGMSGDPNQKVFSEFERIFARLITQCSSISRSEMIPEDEAKTNAWGVFEGASTYEYAHTQVKESRVKTAA